MRTRPKASSDKNALYAALQKGVAAMIEGERDFHRQCGAHLRGIRSRVHQ